MTAKQRQKHARVQRTMTYLYLIKQGTGCSCGENRPAALDFHHLEDKSFNITHAVRRGMGIERINKEIAKCVVMCANCHRVAHSRVG